MKKILNKQTLVIVLVFLAAIACKKKEQSVTPPVPGNEFMTTVKIRFENAVNSNDTIWAVWKDLIPEDTNSPDTSGAVIALKVNTAYHASVYFYDETKNPAEDLTLEVRELANFHSYWFFKTGEISNHLTITPTDYDNNTPPLILGLKSDFSTDATPSTGRLEGILRHQPSGKDGTFAPGSTDSDVFFTLNIVP